MKNEALIGKIDKPLSETCRFLEQVTRVELAGNSLGSCRHTARRRLQNAKFSLSVFIISSFYPFVNAFYALRLKKFSPFFALRLFAKLLTFLTTPEKFYVVSVKYKSVARRSL